MTSQIEGRVLLALDAYNQGTIRSLRAAANTYEVPFETLRQQSKGRLSRQEIRPNSSKFTKAEEELLVHRIMDLVHEGFPPRNSDVRDTANLILKNRNPLKPETVGQKWVYNFVKRQPAARQCIQQEVWLSESIMWRFEDHPRLVQPSTRDNN